MGTIAQKLTYLEDTKTAIGNAIAAKGGSVTGKTFRQYATEIENLPSGGGNQDLIDLIEGDITTFSIPSGTTKIRKYAFNSLASLTSVTIPNSVTSIGDGAFTSCHIQTIDIGDNIVEIGNDAFIYCSYLNRVNIESLEGWCNVDFKTIYSNPLQTAKHLYMNGNEILNLVIPSTVTSILRYAFINCQFTSLTIPDSVTTIGQQSFYYCNSLTSISFGSGLTTIDSFSFAYCTGLTSVTIPNSVTSIDSSAFQSCTGLTTVTIGSGVTSIGGSALNGCSSLTSITVEATTPPTLVSGAFNNTNNCPIYVPAESVDAYKAASQWSGLSSRIQAIPTE